MIDFTLSPAQSDLQARVSAFVAAKVLPFEGDPRNGSHGPSDELRIELNALAREAGLLAPHAPRQWGGMGLNHVDTAIAFEAAGFSPLGPIALHCAAPDEGNMNLLARVGTPAQQQRWQAPLVRGELRSCFAMTEPMGAGADPTGILTTARRDGGDFVVDGRKWLITGAKGAGFTIIMADVPDEGPTMLLADMASPGIHYRRDIDSMDSSFTGGHGELEFADLRIPADQVLGEVGQGFRYVQVRLAPARLTHCMRWLGAAVRAQSIALDYARRRQAFGRPIGEHEGIGFQLADNEIDLQQSRLLIWWAAGLLDRGEKARHESSLVKTAVSEALFRVADRCVQVLGGLGVTNDTVVAQIFREIRAFRIYDGPSEVHRWAIARRILKAPKEA